MKKDLKDNILKFPSVRNKNTQHSRGLSLFNEGFYFYKTNKDTIALKKFLQAENEGFESAEMFFYMGFIYHIFEEYDNAEKYCLKAIKINDEFAIAHSLLGYIYYKLENIKKSLKHYLKAEEYGCCDADVLEGISRIYTHPKNYNFLKAMEYANKQISYFPQSADAYYWKGYLLFKNIEYEKALPYLLKAEKLSTHPEEDLYYKISYCYSMIDKTQNALEYANKIIFLQKDHYLGYYRKGFTYFTSGDMDHAQENFLLADKYNCPEADMYARLAYTFVYSSTKDKEKAFKYVNEALKLNNKETESYYVLGCIYLDIENDYKTAVKYFRLFYKKEPYPSAEFYSNYCYTLIQLHQYKKANKYLDEALKLFNKEEYLYNQKIEVTGKLKNYKEQYKTIQKLYNLDRTNPNAIYDKAAYFFNRKRKSRKYEQYLLTIKYCSKLPDEIYDKFALLGFCYMNINNFEKSFYYMEKFLNSPSINEIIDGNKDVFRRYYKKLVKNFPNENLIKIFKENYSTIIAE